MIVVIPAYNEAENLPRVLEGVRAAVPDAEVVVVDDGSRDDTPRVAAQHGARVLRHPFNLGYGAALQTGYKYAMERGADVLVQIDADGQHDPGEILKLVAALQRDECDLVIGSRFVEPSGYAMSRSRNLGRRVFQALGRLAGVNVTDPTSGFQAMNRKVLELYCGDFFPPDYPDVDVLVTASRAGIRIRELPVRMHESLRESTLHGGSRAFYYVYKMLLSLWAASRSTGVNR